MSLIDVKNLKVEFETADGIVSAVNNVNFSMDEGKILAIVGESGSGKSQTVFGMTGLLDHNGSATGSVKFEGEEILNLSNQKLNQIRAEKIAMIFQDPMTSLNPYVRVSEQMTEVLIHHQGVSKSDALKQSISMLDAVRIPDASNRIRMYPHEFSGGMRQRVMIAMSLLCRPKLLIADEPTTALDVTVQAQIMKLLADLQKDFGMSIILITHDLGVVAGSSDDMLVMYGGEIMEIGKTENIYAAPTHPYTQGLMSAVPRLDDSEERLVTIPGNPPNMMKAPEGCPFAPRCKYSIDKCNSESPILVKASNDDHFRACHVSKREDTMNNQPILEVKNLKVNFDVSSEGDMPWTKAKKLQAVNDISFSLNAGETLGVVGESGCGKSTLARAIVKMVPAEAGEVIWLGNDLLGLSHSETRPYRKQIQMIFQDPLASLNPRMNIGEIIAEPLRTHYPKTPEADVQARVIDVMNKVGLLDNLMNRYPHEFSGGQCQRIGIARALILKPKLIICDEPVSALDVSIQAQVVNLLMDLQEEMKLALIFIAHDLSVVKHISTKIMVLYLGNMVELAKSDEIYKSPSHPYTQALISAVPIPDPNVEKNKDLILIEGDLPSPINPPSGCVFRTRCQKAQEVCALEKPEFKGIAQDHSVACHFHD